MFQPPTTTALSMNRYWSSPLFLSLIISLSRSFILTLCPLFGNIHIVNITHAFTLNTHTVLKRLLNYLWHLQIRRHAKSDDGVNVVETMEKLCSVELILVFGLQPTHLLPPAVVSPLG